MKALRHAFAFLAPALVGAVACGGAGESSPSDDARTGSVASSIVGGTLDTTTKGVVALAQSAHGQLGVVCSGSLLAPNLVLTARHCVSQIGDGSSEQVTCETSQFTSKYDPRQRFISTDAEPRIGSKLYPIKEVREAPGSSNVCGFDIALLILSGSGIPESEAKPIEPVLDQAPGAKQAFAAVGYGLQDPNDKESSGRRMRFDTSSVFCVGDKCPGGYDAESDEWVGKSPVCSGDSGGPALDADGRVFGVTSRGDDQCTFAIYSNVANWATFLRSAAIAAATSGNYDPPSWATEVATSGAGGNGSSDENAGSGNAGGGNSGSANTAGFAGTVSPPAEPGMPTVDPLGTTCESTNDCLGSYVCYSTSNAPPGICVPQCSAQANSCPAGYSCSQALKACTPAHVTTARVSGSCAVGSAPSSGSGAAAFSVVLALGMLWIGRRRRCLA